jgi:hypothetical protein
MAQLPYFRCICRGSTAREHVARVTMAVCILVADCHNIQSTHLPAWPAQPWFRGNPRLLPSIGSARFPYGAWCAVYTVVVTQSSAQGASTARAWRTRGQGDLVRPSLRVIDQEALRRAAWRAHLSSVVRAWASPSRLESCRRHSAL